MLKKVIKAMAIILSAVFMVSLVACSTNVEVNNTEEPKTTEPSTLKVGMSGNLKSYLDWQADEETDSAIKEAGLIGGIEPYCWIQDDDSNGAVKISNSDKYMNGYDVRIAKKIAEQLNKELVIVSVEWVDLVDKVKNGEIDLIMSGMTPSSERRQEIDFSDYYYTSGISFVVRSDGDLKNATKLVDFKGKALGSMANTVPYSLLDAIENVDKVPYDDFTKCEVALAAGQIDGLLTDTPIANVICAKSNLDIFKVIDVTNQFNLSKDDYSIAAGMKKDSNLKSRVNEAISKLTDNDKTSLMNEAIKAAAAK